MHNSPAISAISWKSPLATIDVALFYSWELYKLAKEQGYSEKLIQKYLSWHTPNELIEKMLDPTRFFRIIRDTDGRIIAYFESKEHSMYKDTQVMQWMLIDEKYRKNGQATRVYEEFKKWCLENNYTSVWSYADIGNHASRKWHMKILPESYTTRGESDNLLFVSHLQ